jgi:hypothetical protein
MLASWSLSVGTLLALEVCKQILRLPSWGTRTAFVVFRRSCGVQLSLMVLSDCVPLRVAMFEGKRRCQKKKT